MQKIHSRLLEKSQWYAKWHKHPSCRYFHFFALAAVAVILTAMILGSINQSMALSEEQAKGLVLASKTGSSSVGSTNQPPQHVAQRLLVKFHKNTITSKAQKVLSELKAQSESIIKGLNVHLVKLPLGANEEQMLEAFRKRAEVVYAELDYERQPALNPNDPNFFSQWMFTNIKAPTAWSTTTGSAIKIAVIDTGVNSAHPDLTANILPGWNFWDNNSNTTDTAQHGTFMAGTLAAVTNNGVGVAGTCWTCKIMPLKVSNSSNTATDSTVAQALLYAKDQGVKIAVIGYPVTGSSVVGDAASQFVAAGGIVIVPIGNDGLLSTTIANSPYMMTVGGTSTMDGPALYSNSGPHMDISAPAFTLSTSINDYGSNSGTSFSAAYVAGVAALVQTLKPSCTGSALVSHLQQTSDDLGLPGFDNIYGRGRLNAATAVAQAGSCGSGGDTQAPTAPTNLSASAPIPTQVNLSWTASTDNVGVKDYLIYRNTLQIASASVASFIDVTVTASSTYNYYVKARDAAGNLSLPSNTATVNVPPVSDPISPTVSITFPANNAFVKATTTIQATATDNIGVASVAFSVDGVTKCTDTTAPYSCAWNTKTASNGPHTVTALAKDAANNSSSASITSRVDNQLPTVTLTAPLEGATVGAIVAMTATATDNLQVLAVVFQVDGVTKCQDTTAPYTCNWNSVATPNGIHQLRAIAVDGARNMKVDLNNVTVSN